MKFEIMSADFKSAMERASALAGSKEGAGFLKIAADLSEQKVRIYTFATYEKLMITISDCHVWKEGISYVMAGDIEKVLGLKGFLTVSVDKKMFTVQTENKKRTVPIKELSENYFVFEPDYSYHICDINEKEFIWTLDKLMPLAGNDSRIIAREAIQGFNLDIKEHIVAVTNGHALMRRKLGCYTEGKTCTPKLTSDLTIRKIAGKTLKKIGHPKNEGDIELYYHDHEKYPSIIISGDDYDYSVELTPGEFFNVERIFSSVQEEYSFTVSPKELEISSKEFLQALKKEKNRGDLVSYPMVITNRNGDLYLTAISRFYSQEDKLETATHLKSVPDDYFFGLSPQYLNESSKIFESEDILVYGKYLTGKDEDRVGCINGLIMTDGRWEYCLLPITISYKTADFHRGIKKEAAA